MINTFEESKESISQQPTQQEIIDTELQAEEEKRKNREEMKSLVDKMWQAHPETGRDNFHVQLVPFLKGKFPELTSQQLFGLRLFGYEYFVTQLLSSRDALRPVVEQMLEHYPQTTLETFSENFAAFIEKHPQDEHFTSEQIEQYGLQYFQRQKNTTDQKAVELV